MSERVLALLVRLYLLRSDRSTGKRRCSSIVTAFGMSAVWFANCGSTAICWKMR